MNRPAFIAELLEAAGDSLPRPWVFHDIRELARYIEELEAGRDAARKEALEEAAKVVEKNANKQCWHDSPDSYC